MNISKLKKNSFRDLSGGTLNATFYDFTVPQKFKKNTESDIYPSVNICDVYIYSLSHSSLIIWKYFNPKNIKSSCQEYFLPPQSCVSSVYQSLIIFDVLLKEPKHCMFVDNNGLIRFWPKFGNIHEFFDQKISYISNDKCILLYQINDNLISVFFESKKIILCDISEFSEAGIILKQFQQSDGLISGISRRFSSLFFSHIQNEMKLKNVRAKTDDDIQGETELMFMYDDLSVLKFDVLYNGTISKNLVDINLINTIILDKCLKNDIRIKGKLIESNIINFDISGNIIYLLVAVLDSSDKNLIDYILMAFNRRMDIFESFSLINLDLQGDIYMNVIEECDENLDNLCLLAAIIDDNHVFIVEVLTGLVKCQLDLSTCTDEDSNIRKSILGYGILSNRISHDPSLIMIVYSVDGHMICLKQQVVPLVASRSVTASSIQLNKQDLDSVINRSSNITMRTKSNHEGGDIKTNMMAVDDGVTSNNEDGLITSGDTMNIDISYMDTSVLGIKDLTRYVGDYDGDFKQFYQGIILFWLGYKSKSGRLIQPLVEESKLVNENHIPMHILRIIKEIIDEFPIKDPRWKKIIDSEKFCFSNKTLSRDSQISHKKEALIKLLDCLQSNKIDSSFVVNPLVASRLLFHNNEQLDLNIVSSSKWPIVDCIRMSGEILEFVRIFNEVMIDLSSTCVGEMLQSLTFDVAQLQRKLEPLEIISQKVSLIPSFIHKCIEYIENFKSNINHGNETVESVRIGGSDSILNKFKKTCNLIARLFSIGLRASLTHRKRFTRILEENFVDFTSCPNVACWITTLKPIGVLESLVEIILNLLEFSSNFQYSELFGWSYDVGYVLLECFKWNIELMENRMKGGKLCEEIEEEYDRVKDTFQEIRYQIIEKIVRNGFCMDKALEMSDDFRDFYWLTSICELKDGDPKNKTPNNYTLLFSYLEKLRNTGFSEYVLSWYQDRLTEGAFKNPGLVQAKVQRILEKIQKIEVQNTPSSELEDAAEEEDELNTSSVAIIDRFLERNDVQSTSWLHQLEIGNFNWAAQTLEKLGLDEEKLVCRKKSLLSLSKLCLVASNQEHIREKCWGSLELVELQDKIPKKIIESELGYPEDKIPPIPVTQLVQLFLTSLEQENDIKYAVYAMDLLNLSVAHRSTFKISHSDIIQLKNNVWIQLLLIDNWTDTSDVLASPRTVVKAAQLAMESGTSVEMVFPEMIQFKEELEKRVNDEHQLYHMQLEMERLNNQLNIQDYDMLDTSLV